MFDSKWGNLQITKLNDHKRQAEELEESDLDSVNLSDESFDPGYST